jgi:hypothetical protein
MLDGVPMNWMTRWSSPFPPFLAEAHGARFTCVDGHEYIDFCLGDTGAMTGHSPAAAVEAIRAQAGRGITTMLPTEDAIWVAASHRPQDGRYRRFVHCRQPRSQCGEGPQSDRVGSRGRSRASAGSATWGARAAVARPKEARLAAHE